MALTASTLDDRQIGLPRSDLAAVLLGHHPGDLRDMAEVVDYPNREKLAQGDPAQFGVGADEL